MTSAVATAFVYALGFFAPPRPRRPRRRSGRPHTRPFAAQPPASRRRRARRDAPQRRAARRRRVAAAVAVLLLLGVALLLQLLPEGAAVVSDATLPPADEYRMLPLTTSRRGFGRRCAQRVICAVAARLVFFVRRGRRDRVAIEFQGGGACWSDETCALSKSTFSENIDGDRKFFVAAADAQRARRNATEAPPLPPVGEGDDLAGLVDARQSTPTGPTFTCRTVRAIFTGATRR